ncbi:MAG: GtrA family protein [Rhodocyclaceae bacterium]
MHNVRIGTALRFLLVGGAATALQYVLIFVFLKLGWLDPVPASALAFALSAIVNYLATARFTFATRNSHAHGLPRFAATAAAGCLINTLVLHALLAWSTPLMPAQIFATGVVFVWNYMINALWTFRPQQR